ncbi:hypothetical protein OEZ86_005884 [Tetradesmus obliquus]|nr:hypothetical protein OEZ86_005884 [Tetradesmus obliquus]
MLLAVQKRPGVQAFSSSITSAADPQDVAAAHSKLHPSSVKDQFVQELRLALWLGRTLALPSEEQVSCKRHIEFKDVDGRVQQLQVDLSFPANSRTITRLMDAWWGKKGGRPPGSSKKAAAAVAGTSKPQFKAMPVTFNFAVGKVLYLQAELLSALAQIDSQMLALKQSGHPMWFHPSSLTSGAKFLGNSFAQSKGASAPPADLMQLHHRPSLYSLRSMHAGEVFLIIRQLPKAILPSNIWDWYIARAGRSAAAKSWRTYVDNYIAQCCY